MTLCAAVFLLTISFSYLTHAAIKTQYTYDTGNRLTKIVYSNGRKIEFSYDNNGNLTKVDRTTSSSGTFSGPVISSQPVYRPVEIGETLTLSISASGVGLTYQWYKDGTALANSGDVSGATTPTLTIINLDANDEGGYYCIVTDSASSTTTSESANVMIFSSGGTDSWDIATSLAPGSRFEIYSFEVGYSDFIKKPKAYAELVERVGGKVKKYSLQALSKPSPSAPLETLQYIWKSAVPLFDKKAFKSYYKSGLTCDDFLIVYPQDKKESYIIVEPGKNLPHYLNRLFSLVAPSITDVQDENETASITSASAGDIITVNGNYFGEKMPKIWLEYSVLGKSYLKQLKLKIQKPLEYISGKGKVAASCMNVDTGVSKIKVQIPSSLPKGIIKGNNNIVIENKQGLATYSFELK
jgi:YD repeat-containing protein